MLRKTLLASLTLVLFSFLASAQIKPVQKFLKENDDNVQKFFIYQSTLRMLNQSGDPDFNKLIKNIRKINVYITEEGGTGSMSTSSYKKLITELTAEKFETLVSAKYEKMLLNFMSKETSSGSYYVFAMAEGSNFGLMEMDGELDLRYLQSIEKINLTQLRKIVGQDDASQSEESHN